jgi:SAM-dependent methyltransferase
VSRQPAWWEAFFSGLWLDVQRRANSAEQTQRDTARILELLAVDPGAHLLDVPCGDGRVALELAARGYQLTGVDLAAPLLADARRHARERGLAVAWEQRDMRALPCGMTPSTGPSAGGPALATSTTRGTAIFSARFNARCAPAPASRSTAPSPRRSCRICPNGAGGSTETSTCWSSGTMTRGRDVSTATLR